MFDPANLDLAKVALVSGGGGTMGFFHEAGVDQGFEDCGIPVNRFGCYTGLSAGAYNSYFLAEGDNAKDVRSHVDGLMVFLSNLEGRGALGSSYVKTRRLLEVATDGVWGLLENRGKMPYNSFYSALVASRLKRINGGLTELDDLDSAVFLEAWDPTDPETRIFATSTENAERLQNGDPHTRYVSDIPIPDFLAGSSSFLWSSGSLKDGGYVDPNPADVALKMGYDVFIINPIVPIPGHVNSWWKNGEQNWRRGFYGRFQERLATHRKDFPDSRIVLIQPDFNDPRDECMSLFLMRMEYEKAFECGRRNAAEAIEKFLKEL
jgi:predicted acylesterase/phospholipase RssA